MDFCCWLQLQDTIDEVQGMEQALGVHPIVFAQGFIPFESSFFISTFMRSPVSMKGLALCLDPPLPVDILPFAKVPVAPLHESRVLPRNQSLEF